MATSLDWSRFESGPVGPDRAFEAFTAQLFERWLRREVGPEFTSYVLEGAGGDGGVEAFAVLPDGSVRGLQAKWFPENLNDSRVRQIRGSLDTAMKRYSGLSEYIVAMPKNLTKGTPGTGGKLRKGGVERWDGFIADVKADYPSLEVIRWDEAGLLKQLAQPGNQEIKAAWFSSEFIHDHIDTAWKKTRSRLQARYLPELHAVGEVDTILDEDLWSNEVVNAARSNLEDARRQLDEAIIKLGDFEQLSDGRRPSDLDHALPEARSELKLFGAHAGELGTVLSSGPRPNIPPCPRGDGLWSFGAAVQALKDAHRGTYVVDYAQGSLDLADAAVERIRKVDTWLRKSAAPRLICGPPGCGKTHAGASVVEERIRARAPAIMVLAKEHSPSQGARDVLSRTLDVPQWPLRRILDGLEALAVLHQLASGGDERPFARTLLLLDGLEESTNADRWVGVLSDLAVEMQSRPRVHLAATLRPEFYGLVSMPDVFCVAYTDEHADVALPELFRAYTQHFEVDVDAVPWLGWAMRTPLEIRLFTEEFRGRTVEASDGARSNLLTLFRGKLDRLEREARERAGEQAWSHHLGLIPVVLTTVAALCASADAPRVADTSVIQAAGEHDPEFTPARVRSALELLREHGLVDRWIPPAAGLLSSKPEYGLATRHVSDFLLASQLAEEALEALRGGTKLSYPTMLRWREVAAVLYAATLAEHGHHIVDIEWDVPPDDPVSLQAQALSLLAPELTADRSDEVQGWLIASTANNRAVLQRLVVPVARIPDHPLGPRVLDGALRRMPMHERDPFWSVPEDLEGTGPWQRCFNPVLDEFELEAGVDRWDGLPLLAAWTCSTVVDERRRRAREMLAEWGAEQLGEMVKLLEHMADVDDPQILDDLVVAALGAAAGAPVDDKALPALARLVDRLFFADDAPSWTTSVPIRFGARGIIERAAMVYPGEFEAELVRARPPYSPRGDWPAIHWSEVEAYSHHGGGLVTGDLNWYVADQCFKAFSAEQPRSRPPEARSVDYRLTDAVDAGALEAPPEMAKRRKKARASAAQARKKRDEQRERLFAALAALHSERTDSNPDGDRNGEPSEDDLLDWAMTQPEFQSADADEESERPAPPYSPQFADLLASTVASTHHDVSPKALRNGMIAHLVRSWGWSESRFCKYDWDNPPSVVDDAIAQRHGSGARYYTRSAVARFREKYVSAAIDRIAGALADRLPVWSTDAGDWEMLRNIERVGISIADPMPGPEAGEAREAAQVDPWNPDDVLVDQFADVENLAQRAEAWLTKGLLPDPTAFVRGAVEAWKDAAVLSLSHWRRGHQSCIDQLVEMRSFAIDPAQLHILRRDAPYTLRGHYEEGAWVEEGTYTSPAIACWAPWMTWGGEDRGYNSFDEEGGVLPVLVEPLVGGITAHFEGEWPQEPRVWMPAPVLREGLGIAAMRGGRWHRSYVDRDGVPRAVERDVPSKSFSFDHHYLATDWSLFAELLRKRGRVAAWVVRVCREATPALFMNERTEHELRDGLKHHSRDTVWLVIDKLDDSAPEVVELANSVKSFASASSEEEAT